MKASKSKSLRSKTAAKPAKASKPKTAKAVKPKASKPPKPQDISELRTFRLPWGLCSWLQSEAKGKQVSQTSIVKVGLRGYLKARLKPTPISEKRAALMRKVARLARAKLFPALSLAKDPPPLSAQEAEELLKDPVAKELYEIACEEMSRPTPKELAAAGL